MNLTRTDSTPKQWREPAGSGAPRYLDAASIPPGDAIPEREAAALMGYVGAPCKQLREAFSMGLISAVPVDGPGEWQFLRSEIELRAARRKAIQTGEPLFFSRQMV